MEVLKNALNRQDCLHLVLYGPRHSQKYEKLRELCYEKYKLRYLQCVNEGLLYYRTRYYHELSIQNIRHKNYEEFKKYIYEVVRCHNSFTNYERNILVFRNYDFVKDSIQSFLRVIVEKYAKTTLFVFITCSYPSIHEAIRSRTLGIRFEDSSLSTQDSDVYRKICKSLIDIYLSNNTQLHLNTIQKLKDISFRILKYPYELSEFCRCLCTMISEIPRWTNNHKHYMITYIAHFQKNLKLSYRKIIHVEALLLTLWDLSHHAYYDSLNLKSLS